LKTSILDLNDGVKAKFGNKEKNNQVYLKGTRRLDNGVIRMSKNDYLQMVDEKGLQNSSSIWELT
jgi:hypothetical protein